MKVDDAPDVDEEAEVMSRLVELAPQLERGMSKGYATIDGDDCAALLQALFFFLESGIKKSEDG